MKDQKQTTRTSQLKTTKVFKSLDSKQLESIIGGPVTSRGTETVVQTQN
jgi:bacteriocin-like protein